MNIIKRLFEIGVNSVKPSFLINKIGNDLLEQKIQSRDTYIIGFGKAALGFISPLSERIEPQTKMIILSVPEPSNEEKRECPSLFTVPKSLESRTTVFYGSRSNATTTTVIEASRCIFNLLKSLKPTDCLTVIITGGGSALLCYPEDGIELSDIVNVTNVLSRKGASIFEMNRIRRSLDKLKGGGIVRHCQSETIISLILSDVIGDDISIIASGPTDINDSAEISSCDDLINKFALEDELPLNVLDKLRTSLSENSSQLNRRDNVHNMVIGSNRTALESIAREASVICEGMSTIILSNTFTGVSDSLTNSSSFSSQYFISKYFVRFIELICDVIYNENREKSIIEMRHVGSELLSFSPAAVDDIILACQRNLLSKFNICLLVGGEVPVKVGNNNNMAVTSVGRGGRCSHLALQLALFMDESKKLLNNNSRFQVHVLCGATDGMDGATDCAGAIVYPYMAVEARQKFKLDPSDFLNRFDSYNFFDKFDSGKCFLRTGLTGTNVMDIFIIYISASLENK